MLRWVALLAAHPSYKAVLLQEGAVGMLLQILSLDAMSSAPVGRLGWLVCSFRAVSHLCDTTVAFSPTESFVRPLSEDCPTFSDCCALASSLLRHSQAFKDVEQAWRQALTMLRTCDCKFGCPACTMVSINIILDHLHFSVQEKYTERFPFSCRVQMRLSTVKRTAASMQPYYCWRTG